ncbi:MAG: hypothetical protein ABEK36_00540 [Candidatus Aenigmatarchaeota archaeon]
MKKGQKYLGIALCSLTLSCLPCSNIGESTTPKYPEIPRREIKKDHKDIHTAPFSPLLLEIQDGLTK